jgi:hypothetical protein
MPVLVQFVVTINPASRAVLPGNDSGVIGFAGRMIRHPGVTEGRGVQQIRTDLSKVVRLAGPSEGKAKTSGRSWSAGWRWGKTHSFRHRQGGQ